MVKWHCGSTLSVAWHPWQTQRQLCMAANYPYKMQLPPQPMPLLLLLLQLLLQVAIVDVDVADADAEPEIASFTSYFALPVQSTTSAKVLHSLVVCLFL